MHVLGALRGTVATVVLCALLFIDETGVPLPLAPNEVLLLLGGVLISAGALSAWVFYPAALLAMAAGTLVGYGWAHLAGQRGVDALVRRLHAGAIYERGRARLTAAGPVGIAVARLLPGVRPWATLCCGASGIRLRTFLEGALPALVVWEVLLISLGRVVGLPAEHLFGRFERLVLRGALLLVLGVIGYVGLQRLARQGSPAQQWQRLWVPLATLVTGGTAASMALGVLAIRHGLARVHHTTWLDALLGGLVAVAVAGVTLVRQRSGTHATSGGDGETSSTRAREHDQR